ncbi:stalk domain-containing protein [Paenibacillus sp. GD4]|uniref:stalk domain-containing protein n=1 Tax=Paenibacillus sp. GD4 TaxID=3068890 RepID=UPI00279687E5|nr:stalk domain-containing protein [Paenibacillus sp. GD4]MDQ1910708.1 stalk domain-containing protein [Paenibacillus sp. GD4]
MKKFVLGLLCGAILAASTTLYASDEIRATLFPVTFQFNGETKDLGSRFAVLNYDGHTYVPVRFMAEQLGAGARYDETTRTVSVQSSPASGSDSDKKVWSVQYRLERGMSQKDVKPIIGEPSFVTLIDSSRQQVSRYDFGAGADYKHGGLNVDTEGLLKGKLDAQLFIRWTTEGAIERMDLWYAKGTEAQRTVHTYIVYPDGTVAEGLYE